MQRQMAIGWTGILALAIGAAISISASAQQNANEAMAAYNSIKWVNGPGTGDLGNATIKVPQGYRFTGVEGTEAFLRATGNVYGGQVGVMEPIAPKGKDAPYFIVFSFHDDGYIKDEDKDKIDDDFAAETLKFFKEGQEQSNKTRTAHGMEPLTVTGWSQKPFFDDQTKNLTWGLLVSGRSGTSVNYESRVLGRRGYMNVNMVLDEADVAKSVPEYRKLVGGMAYKSGETYAEFKSGDKVAEYGLLGLASGGLAIAAVKWGKGLWKIVLVGIAAIGIAIKKVFSMFRSKSATA